MSIQHFSAYEEKIPQIIKKEFPNNELKVIEVFKRSNQSPVYKISTQDNENFVIRFPRTTTGYYFNRIVTLGKEEYCWKLLNEKGFPVPKILSHDKYDETEYIIMSFLKGKSSDEAIREADKKDSVKIIRNIGNIVARFHSIKNDKYAWIDENGPVEGTDSWKEFYFSLVLQKLQDPLIDFELKEKAQNWLLSKEQILNEIKTKPSFVYYDFWGGNILVDDIKVSGLLDPNYPSFAEPNLEFGTLERLMFFRLRKDVDLKSEFYDEYQKSGGELSANRDELIKIYMLNHFLAGILNNAYHKNPAKRVFANKFRNFALDVINNKYEYDTEYLDDILGKPSGGK